MVMSPGDHGPLRDGRVGPYRPTMGVPRAAAMWVGPVSPEITSAAPRRSAMRSPIDVLGERSAVPDDARTTSSASDSSPGPQVTIDRRLYRVSIARATSPNRAAGHRLLGQAAPGLSST